MSVDPSGVIVAQALTDAQTDDATTGVDLIDAVQGDLARVTGDAAYDTIAFYCRGCAGRGRGRSTHQDGKGISTRAAVERS